jgi:hypothetical protein
MKRKSKPILYLALLLLTVLTEQATATDVVKYTYDNAGNRTSRQVVTISGPSGAKKKTADPVTEQLAERKITVYPNPTKGQLAIDITGGNEKDELRIIIFDANGKQLFNKKVEPGTTPVNMNSYPAAYYILRVQAGEKQTEFKIIKQ